MAATEIADSTRLSARKSIGFLNSPRGKPRLQYTATVALGGRLPGIEMSRLALPRGLPRNQRRSNKHRLAHPPPLGADRLHQTLGSLTADGGATLGDSRE